MTTIPKGRALASWEYLPVLKEEICYMDSSKTIYDELPAHLESMFKTGREHLDPKEAEDLNSFNK